MTKTKKTIKLTVTSFEAAAMLGISESVLKKWRMESPNSRICLPYIRIGNKLVRYLISDLENFLEQSRIDE